MTISNISSSLFRLSVGGYFNHEKWTRARLTNTLRHWFGQVDGIDRITPDARSWKKLVMEIALPDGWWLFCVYQTPNGEFGYDIPETRQQERQWFPEFKAMHQA